MYYSAEQQPFSMDINLSRARNLQVEVYAKKVHNIRPLKSCYRNRWEFIKTIQNHPFRSFCGGGEEEEGGGGGRRRGRREGGGRREGEGGGGGRRGEEGNLTNRKS
jgi:hypothetical protein